MMSAWHSHLGEVCATKSMILLRYGILKHFYKTTRNEGIINDVDKAYQTLKLNVPSCSCKTEKKKIALVN